MIPTKKNLITRSKLKKPEWLILNDVHDYMDVGDRAMPGAIAEEARMLPQGMPLGTRVHGCT